MVRTVLPVCMSQTRTTLSSEEETICLPSGVTRTFHTFDIWPPVSSMSCVALLASCASPLPAGSSAAKSTAKAINRIRRPI